MGRMVIRLNRANFMVWNCCPISQQQRFDVTYAESSITINTPGFLTGNHFQWHVFNHKVCFIQMCIFNPKSKIKRYRQKTCTLSLMHLFFCSLWKFVVNGQNGVVQQWGWFCGSVTSWKKRKKKLGLSNPKNKTRAGSVSPAYRGAVELSRRLYFRCISGCLWSSLTRR